MDVMISMDHESDMFVGFIQNFPAVKDDENGKEQPNDNQGEVKLSLLLNYLLHHKDISVSVGVSQQVLMSARDWTECSASRFSHFTPEKQPSHPLSEKR
jgi:hypothetical protein